MHLVIVGGRQIGDLILQQPAIHAAAYACAPSCVTLYVTPLVKPITSFLGIDRTFNVEVREFRPTWAKHPWGHQYNVNTQEARESVHSFIAELSDMRPDFLVVLDEDPWLTHSPELQDIPFEHLGYWDQEELSLKDGHQSWRFYKVVSSSALPPKFVCPEYQAPSLYYDMRVEATEEYIQMARRIQEVAGRRHGVVVIQPKGSYGTKDVSPATWGHIIKGVSAMGFCPILIGVETDTFESPSSETTKRQVRRAVDWRGKLSLRETFHLIHQADLTIGVDSFAVHASGAYSHGDERYLGKFICLFSSTNDPCRWGAASRPGSGRVFCLPPWNRKKYSLGLTAYPEGTKGWPYTERIRAADVLDAAYSMLALP